MTSRNTNTGAVLEAMILPALTRSGYQFQLQVPVGRRPGGRAHKADVMVERDGTRMLISLKWQQTAGTAEQKVPFEAMCLIQAILAETDRYRRAYLVLGGDRWTLRDYFTSGALDAHLIHAKSVRIVTLEAFVRLANTGQL